MSGPSARVEVGSSGRGAVLSASLPAELRTGAECWLELTVEAVGEPVYVASGTDRRTGRPTPLEITGDVDGTALADPQAAGLMIGGPTGAVLVEPGSPLRQRVRVNDFLRLSGLDCVEPGRRARLRLRVRRPLPVAGDAAAALTAGAESAVEVEVTATLVADREG